MALSRLPRADNVDLGVGESQRRTVRTGMPLLCSGPGIAKKTIQRLTVGWSDTIREILFCSDVLRRHTLMGECSSSDDGFAML